jgi:hypothetical protein
MTETDRTWSARTPVPQKSAQVLKLEAPLAHSLVARVAPATV